MYLDRFNEFCDGTALNTGAAGSYLVGNQIDTVYPRDVGHGSERLLYLVAQVSTTATSAGAATLQLQLRSDATAAVSPTTGTLHASSSVFAVANLPAGTVLWVTPLPWGSPEYEQFLGIVQVTGVAAFTAGNIDVFLTPDPQHWKAYADEASR